MQKRESDTNSYGDLYGEEDPDEKVQTVENSRARGHSQGIRRGRGISGGRGTNKGKGQF